MASLPPRLGEFIDYINERVAIRERRAQGLSRDCWTADPILREYKFCNAKRDWDRTTQWLMANWYGPLGSHANAGRACALARFVGYWPTLAEVGFPTLWTPEAIKSVLLARQLRGEQTWTGAYMIRGDRAGVSKAVTVLDAYIGPPIDAGVLDEPWPSAWALYAKLRTFYGWGAFMTQEVVLDCMKTFVLERATDKADFAVAGPGALKGLQFVFGETVGPINEARGIALMENLRVQMLRDDSGLCPEMREGFTLHDVEFNLCEMQKYARTKYDGGRPKARFNPTP